MIFSSVPVYFVFISWKNKPKFFQKAVGKYLQLAIIFTDGKMNRSIDREEGIVQFVRFYRRGPFRVCQRTVDLLQSLSSLTFICVFIDEPSFRSVSL